MEGAQNNSKNDTPLEQWLETLGDAKTHFIASNYVPDGVSLKVADFEIFRDGRKALLRSKLKEVLQ